MPGLAAVALGFDRMGCPFALWGQPPRAPGTPDLPPQPARLAFSRWFYTHCNLRVAGGYITCRFRVDNPPAEVGAVPPKAELTDDRRAWRPHFRPLREAGWGIAMFALVNSRLTYYDGNANPVAFPRRHGPARPVATRPYGSLGPNDYDFADVASPFLTPMNRDTGTGHARWIKWIMATYHPELANAVVYLDNEDGTGLLFHRGEREYYQALFTELATRREDEPAIRPGLYAHATQTIGGVPAVASQLVELYPGLFVCDVNYGNRKGRPGPPAGPNGAVVQPAPDPLHLPASTDNALRSFPVTSRSTPINATWWQWPSLKQFEGDNQAVLPTANARLRFRGLDCLIPPQGIWDFDSALVPDPTYPAGEPRIAAAATVDGALVACASRTEVASDVARADARVDVFLVKPDGTQQSLAMGLRAPDGYVLVPGAQLAWFGDPPRFLVTTCLSADSSLVVPLWCIWERTKTGMGPAALILAGGFSARTFAAGPSHLHSPVAAASAATPSGMLNHLLSVDHNGPLQGLQGDSQQPNWGEPAEMGQSLRLHPFCQLAATMRRGDVLDVFAIDEAGRLMTAWCSPVTTAWPGNKSHPIGAASALLPSTSLAAVHPVAWSLVVFGVGSDLRLQVAHWIEGSGWEGPKRVAANDTQLLLPQTRLSAIAVNIDRCLAVAMSAEPAIRLYDVRKPGSSWEAATAPAVVGAPVTAPGAGPDDPFERAPHPFGDLAIAGAGARIVIVAVWAERGRSRAWYTSGGQSAPGGQSKWADWKPLA